jgi:5'-deoxynucleotidase YfbR-like HD superfamily hydrolase
MAEDDQDYTRYKILTSSGVYVNYVTPTVDSIRIQDIAHGLSNECRYAGQCLHFYSVAQHCVLASYLVPNGLAMEALFHDSTEAYLKDLPTWLKMLLPGYREIEERFEQVIRIKFGLPTGEVRATNKRIIKEVDYKLLATEKRDLMPRDGEDWTFLKNVSPMPFEIVPWTPKEAKEKFLARYEELRNIHDQYNRTVTS